MVEGDALLERTLVSLRCVCRVNAALRGATVSMRPERSQRRFASPFQLTNLHKYRGDRERDNLHVERQGFVFHVVKVQFHHLLERGSILARDLPKAGEAGQRSTASS